MVLDENVLHKIPLKERLLFTPERRLATQVFHKSIVEKVLSLDAKGISFVKVSDWNIRKL